MTHYLIDVEEFTRTNPRSPVPQTVDTRRTIVQATPDGPCRRPATIARNGHNQVVPCGRVLSPDRQCQACRTTVTIRSTTVTDLGPQSPTATSAVSGNLPDPCPACGALVSAVLADLGRHILCPPIHLTWIVAQSRATGVDRPSPTPAPSRRRCLVCRGTVRPGMSRSPEIHDACVRPAEVAA